MDVRFHSLPAYTDPETPRRMGHAAFKASWQNTLNLLEYELEKLGAHDVVIQVGLRPQDIRIDGWPRGDAQRPKHPGVVVSFESKHGPLRYATDAFTSYQANVRAISLGLEALRKVDRYGISRRGEQYTGWKALPGGQPALNGQLTVEQAARLLNEEAGFHPEAWSQLRHSDLAMRRVAIRDAYRMAAKRHHPDAGGDPAMMRRLGQAREVLEAAE